MKTPERYLSEWVDDEIWFEGGGGKDLKIYSRRQIERLAFAIRNGVPTHGLAVLNARRGKARLAGYVAGEFLDWKQLLGLDKERWADLTAERLAWYASLRELIDHYHARSTVNV